MAATAGPSRSPVADPSQNVATTGGHVNIDSTLQQTFSLLLDKSFQAEPEAVVRPATINFMWSGGGLPLNLISMDPILVEIPFPARLVWVHFYAGDAKGRPAIVNATFEMILTNQTVWGSYTPLYSTGTPPTIVEASTADIDLTDWAQNLATGDTLLAFPSAFTGTGATWAAITVQLRPTEQSIGNSQVTDNVGDLMTFTDDTPVEFVSATA
jgi:hypothetical protein